MSTHRGLGGGIAALISVLVNARDAGGGLVSGYRRGRGRGSGPRMTSSNKTGRGRSKKVYGILSAAALT